MGGIYIYQDIHVVLLHMSTHDGLYYQMAQVKRENKQEFNERMKGLRESTAGHMAVCKRLHAVGVDKCPSNYSEAIKLATTKGVLSEKDRERALEGKQKGNMARHSF